MEKQWYEKLREARLGKSLTLKEVAAGVAIPLQTYAGYEHGTREPSIEMLKRLCDFFDVSADYLIGRSEY